MFDEKKKEIEAAFQKVAETAKDFNLALMAMRNIELPVLDEQATPEEQQSLNNLAQDLDLRTNFVLRSLLVQHGNVLWM